MSRRRRTNFRRPLPRLNRKINAMKIASRIPSVVRPLRSDPPVYRVTTSFPRTLRFYVASASSPSSSFSPSRLITSIFNSNAPSAPTVHVYIQRVNVWSNDQSVLYVDTVDIPSDAQYQSTFQDNGVPGSRRAALQLIPSREIRETAFDASNTTAQFQIRTTGTTDIIIDVHVVYRVTPTGGASFDQPTHTSVTPQLLSTVSGSASRTTPQPSV